MNPIGIYQSRTVNTSTIFYLINKIPHKIKQRYKNETLNWKPKCKCSVKTGFPNTNVIIQPLIPIGNVYHLVKMKKA